MGRFLAPQRPEKRGGREGLQGKERKAGVGGGGGKYLDQMKMGWEETNRQKGNALIKEA